MSIIGRGLLIVYPVSSVLIVPFSNCRINHTCLLSYLTNKTGEKLSNWYSLRPKKSVVLEFQTSYLIIRLIQIFYINIIYFVKIYFIIRDTLPMTNLFYNLHKIFE